MNYLNREWALNFIFYFCDGTLPGNALLVTDQVARLEVDCSFFNIDMHYCLPDSYIDKLIPGKNDKIMFFSDNRFPVVNQKFQLIIIDLEKTSYTHLLSQIVGNLEEDGNLVIFAWSEKITMTLSKLFWHLGFSNNRRSSLVENQVYDLHGVLLKLNWYFFIVPGLQKPRKLVRRGFRSVIPAESESNAKRILNRIGLFYFQKHHRIIIGKINTSNAAPTFLEQLFSKIQHEEVATRNGQKKSIQLLSISGTKILILDALIGGREFIIRLPLDQIAADRIHKQVQIVKFLNNKDITLVPKAVAYNRDHPYIYYVEEKIQGGMRIQSLAKKNNNSIIPLYEEMLRNVTGIHIQFGETLTVNESNFHTYFLPALNTILENTQNDFVSRNAFDLIKTELFTKLNGKVVMRSICHGDLKIENGIFDSENNLKGIFDWDMGEREGITITDLACLLATSIRIQYYKGHSLVDFMKKFKNVPEEFIPSYNHYFEATQTTYISPQLAILYYWIDRIYKLLKYHFDSNREWMNENINPVLDHITNFLE